MNAGSRDEREMLANIGRIATALERIAGALEQRVYGVTSADVAEAVEMLRGENVRIGEGKLVHANPPRCKTTYTSPLHRTSEPITCAGCLELEGAVA